MKCKDNHGIQRMKPSDLPTFPVVPPCGLIFEVLSEISLHFLDGLPRNLVHTFMSHQEELL